ncbi:S1 family peptidase [Methylococcus sp. Mc7]|uniref:S1 family peptidase n=1 Tax=Methylococcus sp. Mc7 TaxID=2860258 RepID=UPI001C52A6DA|nr:S1 family peptidase [Methylococcus sp. Mc7]QXP84102.1 S1 family peptidase [Methylococcus sp. Mc7]
MPHFVQVNSGQRLSSQNSRIALGKQLVNRLGEDRTASFWLDQENNTVVVAVLDEDGANQVRALGAVSQRVTRSWNELKAIEGSLTGRFRVKNTGIGIDMKQNCVVLTVTEAAERAERERTARPSNDGESLSALLEAALAFGTAVRVEYEAGSYEPAIRGGGVIMVEGQCGSNWCSAGVLQNLGNGNKRILTAGHCTTAASYWDNGSCSRIGYSLWSNYWAGSDMGAIQWTGAASSFKLGEITLYEYGTAYILGSHSSVWTGEWVCKSGYSTHYSCGDVVIPSTTYTYPDGATIYDAFTANVYCRNGDSGSPVFKWEGGNLSGYVWWNGLVSGCNPNLGRALVQGL